MVRETCSRRWWGRGRVGMISGGDSMVVTVEYVLQPDGLDGGHVVGLKGENF
jgi:hypothetical protein